MDLEIILSVADVAIQRQRMTERDQTASDKDHFESKDDNLHERIQIDYNALGRQDGRHLIGATGSIDEIAKQIKQLVTPLLD